ncbi:MAG: phosphate ABC transporter permease PstA [Pirellulaceae bacterium]|jgi:phosphate transport system permease protein|nr:phosphate ABC transporter permease PstA [Pirellulaceae bacterium]
MPDVSQLIRYRKRQDLVFNLIGLACTLFGILALVVLLADLMIDGLPRLSWQFFTSWPSRFASRAGILPAWVGSLCVMSVTLVAAVPLGIAAAVYLEEYAPKNWLTALIEINIANLAGVPSIIYGLMALGIFYGAAELGLGLKRGILLAGVTLGLLVLPIVIVTTREALRSIPSTIREAAYAAGATKWQVVRYHLVPYSLGGIATGTIIAMSRAVGETAPLITIGALTFISYLPPSPIQSKSPFVSFEWLQSGFTVLPIQMFNWTSRPIADFQQNAAATGLVLIAFTLTMNAVAIVVRYRVRKKLKW